MENLFLRNWPACQTSARPFPGYIRHLFRAASRGGWAEWQGGDGGQLLFRAAGVVRGGCPELFVWWWLLFQAVTGAVWRGSKAGRQGRWRLRSGYSGRMAVREALRGSCSEWGAVQAVVAVPSGRPGSGSGLNPAASETFLARSTMPQRTIQCSWPAS